MRYGQSTHNYHLLKPVFIAISCFFGVALSSQSYASTPLTDNELEQNYASIQSSTIKPKKPKNCNAAEQLKLNIKKNKKATSGCNGDEDSDELSTRKDENNKENKENDDSSAESRLGLARNSLSQDNGLSQLLTVNALQKAQNDLTQKNKDEILNSLNQDPLKNTLGQVQINPDGTFSFTSTEPGVIDFGYIYKRVNSETDIEIPSIKVGYTEFRIQTNK